MRFPAVVFAPIRWLVVVVLSASTLTVGARVGDGLGGDGLGENHSMWCPRSGVIKRDE